MTQLPGKSPTLCNFIYLENPNLLFFFMDANAIPPHTENINRLLFHRCFSSIYRIELISSRLEQTKSTLPQHLRCFIWRSTILLVSPRDRNFSIHYTISYTTTCAISSRKRRGGRMVSRSSPASLHAILTSCSQQPPCSKTLGSCNVMI